MIHHPYSAIHPIPSLLLTIIIVFLAPIMASQTGANAHQQPRKLRRDRLHKLRTLINDSLDVYEQELDASGIDELDLDSLESHVCPCPAPFLDSRECMR